MKKSNWSRAISTSADPNRAKHFLELLTASAGRMLAEPSAEQARILVSLFSGSQALSTLLVAHPDWLSVLQPEALQFFRRKQGLQDEVESWLEPLLKKGEFVKAFSMVREFKQREMMRIGARDLARVSNVNEIISELSAVADICLDTTWRICRLQLISRYGIPYHQDASGRWQPTPACMLGMGKLGGEELNYSSDVDVLFVYAAEGEVYLSPPAKGSKAKPTLKNHQFFKRLAEAVIAEVSRMAPQGFLYRIDLRLRPEGEGGPLSRSLTSYENYYAQWGQTWERMMLIKARGVAGDKSLAAEFLETIQPFRFPRSINRNVLSEVAAMKDRIETEVVKSGELDRNVKLGRGGIREIEFVVQSMQLLHAGRQPFLQGTQTVPGLEKLAQYELVTQAEAKTLTAAYCFLRDLEHRLQMENNQQTHTIPNENSAQNRLGRLMGFKTKQAFESAHQAHRVAVRRIFEKLLKGETSTSTTQVPFPRQFEGEETTWKEILTEHGFREVDKAFRVLREFVEGPGYVHVSPRTRELAYNLLPRLFALCPQPTNTATKQTSKKSRDANRSDNLADAKSSQHAPLSDPDRVVTRMDSFIVAYGARATLFELWNSNPGIFHLLVLLFDRSEFLAELAIRTPDLVDELVTSGRLRQRKTSAETLGDLRHGRDDKDQHLWLRKYHQAELMRIGLRDILGLADFEQYLTELSSLADACIQYVVEVVMRRHKIKQPSFAIIGLGKLGGAEIDYGSDLDILFVGDPKGRTSDKLAQMAVEVMDLLSLRTEQGLLFHTDARLRPDGEKGLLVNSLKAYEDYYRQRAALWEIQSLTRSRVIAGDAKQGLGFQQMAAELTNFKKPNLPLAAFSAEWRQKIHHMRMRIEKERTPAGKDELAIKTGRGGLMDAEFIAQTLCLENGWQEANTLHALEHAKVAGVLPDAEKLIRNYRQLRRVEGILRRWSYEGETVLPEDPAPYYRVSIRCGFNNAEEFRASMRIVRQAIREVYQKVSGIVDS